LSDKFLYAGSNRYCGNPMKDIVITGGSGFLGQRVARELLRRSEAGGKTGHQPADRIVLVDVARPQREIADPRVRFATGDAADPLFVREILSDDTDGIFHLAAVVSGAAEGDFDLGMRVNLWNGLLVLLR
jgi:nucleoside-diphosphate-sugar epimerase